MMNSVSNLFNIIGAKAFLASSNAPAGRDSVTYEVWFELHHAGRREVKRWIIWH
jgi:hypothetical protein